MSFLSKLIEDLRRNKINVKSVNDFRDHLHEKLKGLSENSNLRVFHKEQGGVLRGSRSSRKPRENPETGNILCNLKSFEQNNLEVPYFRAVFNLPNRKIELGNEFINLIGYESPLMRKIRGSDNKDVPSRHVSCDLIGLTSSHQVLCIEGKVNPKPRSTDIVHGILESYAYGICLDYLTKVFLEDFREEIKSSITEFKVEISIDAQKEFSAGFALAAPKEYFGEYFKPNHIRKKKAEENIFQATQLLDLLKEIDTPKWWGFLVFPSPSQQQSFSLKNEKKNKNNCFVEPHFEKTDDIRYFESLYDLKNYLFSSG